MGYPGDQQPQRQPYLPEGPPPWGNTPPPGTGAGMPYPADRRSPYSQRERQETSPYDNAEPPPYPPRGHGEHWSQHDYPDNAEERPPSVVDRRPPDLRPPAAGDPSPPPEPIWDPDAPVPLWRRPLLLGTALMALIGALFFGLWFAARNEQPPRPMVVAPTPTPLAPTAPPGSYGYAGSRQTDKSPLMVRELFGKKKFRQDGRSYLMTVWRKEKSCADGVSGSTLKKALKAGKCTQLIRASFTDAKEKIIGTVGVANLATSKAAKKAASAGGGGEREDYLKPLPGKDDATKNLGAGEAYAGGWTHGHYTVLLWFQFKDGHKPSAKELKRLYQAATDITDKTVFPALEHRSLTGSGS